VSGRQLALTPVPEAGVELVDAELVTSAAAAASDIRSSPSPPPAVPGLQERNLFGEAERIAARAASVSTRRQYGAAPLLPRPRLVHGQLPGAALVALTSSEWNVVVPKPVVRFAG